MLLDQAMRATGTDAGAVSLLADDAQPELTSSAGLDAEDEQRFAAAIAASASRAMDERKPVLENVPDGVCGLHRLLTAPLIGPGGPVGVLTIASRTTRRPRSSHMEFIQVLCSEAAMAIENAQLHAQLDRLASTDHLTGLANRREMERVLSVEAERAGRYQRPLTLLSIDVDNLKAVNDFYGHAVGDGVLRALGRVLTQNLRSSDAAGRMGGDEFLVVLPETDGPGGEAFAARLAQDFDAEMRAMQSWKEMAVALGLSIGTAATGDGVAQVGQLLTAADEALYEAKRAAKNRASLAATR
jgi:diguanylate cyclase (GGDEF)-like protein